MDIKEAFESVNDFSQAKNNGESYKKTLPTFHKLMVWIDSVNSEILEMAVAKNIVEQIDAAVDAMYYTADFAACLGVSLHEDLNFPVDLPSCTIKQLTFSEIEELRSTLLCAAIHNVTYRDNIEAIQRNLSETFVVLICFFSAHAGVNPLEFFEIVHTANMKKINPETKCAYVYKDNGNIGKPEGFIGPEKEIQAKAEALGLCVT